MKEFIEKLIERFLGECVIYAENYEKALNIANELTEEFATDTNVVSKNGWIPCSSGNFSTSEVLVCKEDGTIDFDVFDFMYEDWKFNSNHHKNKVIAWMPLPAPYKENENGKI